jgi:hypothetical protein
MRRFITAWVIGLLVVLFVFDTNRKIYGRIAAADTKRPWFDAPILSTKEFPYSVVRGGVHNANEAQLAMDDWVVKLHYAGIDTKRLEATAYQDQRRTLRFLSSVRSSLLDRKTGNHQGRGACFVRRQEFHSCSLWQSHFGTSDAANTSG